MSDLLNSESNSESLARYKDIGEKLCRYGINVTLHYINSHGSFRINLQHVLLMAALQLFLCVECNKTIDHRLSLRLESLQTELGFDCAGGISGLLEKHLRQRKVLPEKVSLTIVGGVLNPNFNDRLAGDISRLPVTTRSLSNGQLNPMDARILDYTVLYYCQDNFKQVVYEKMIRYTDRFLPIRPYVLFTMSNKVGTEITEYAYVQSCRISSSHDG